MQKSKLSVKDLLSTFKIEQLNEMQLASIEAIQNNNAIILLSSTGSGKTLAFLIPLVQILDPAINKVQALIIVPSRELAIQIDEVFRKMASGFKVTLCYGGHKRETEETNLKQSPSLIIGTPGRIADHLRRGNFTQDNITTLVIDEFDKSLELGFEEEMSFIIGSLKCLNKRILTSATESIEIPAFIGLDSLFRLDYLSHSTEMPLGLTIKRVLSREKDKSDTLFKLICFLGNKSILIFCNHRDAVERTSILLKEKGIINEYYHGGMEQQERDRALCKFRNGTTNVLVTTDLASRGLDIPNIKFIIHYHLPSSEEVFIHRNGRTARMDARGTAYIIFSEEEKLPDYITIHSSQQNLPETFTLPEKPKWSTLFIAAGKKDKLNKIDIVGFLSNKGMLKQEDIGLIEVKDFFSFVAVRKLKVGQVLESIKNEKIKKMKVKIEIAR